MCEPAFMLPTILKHLESDIFLYVCNLEADREPVLLGHCPETTYYRQLTPCNTITTQWMYTGVLICVQVLTSSLARDSWFMFLFIFFNIRIVIRIVCFLIWLGPSKP